MAGIKAVTDAEFETEVLRSDRPVLVGFWADWCAPCHVVAPILEDINAEHGDRLAFAKLNIDENPLTPARYEVISIPTLNVYHHGEVVRQIIGALPKPALLTELSDFIDGPHTGGS
jgi:thioredoxin 1